jgi:hypothetical protein
MAKLYLTESATTTGEIQEVEVLTCQGPEFFVEGKGYYTVGKQIFWHESEARDAVEAAVKKRITSLEKQINKLKNVQVVVKEAA